MLAKGDKLWVTANYADGWIGALMSTGSLTSLSDSSSGGRVLGGAIRKDANLVFNGTSVDTTTGWNVAALFQHFWAPQWRSVAFASYGQLDAPNGAASRNWDGNRGFGDATVWNVGTNLAWLPTRDFEIGVEVIYARVSQDINNGSTITRANDSNVTGRLRVERNF